MTSRDTNLNVPSWTLETPLWTLGYTPVAGVDEAGRGALAGPVVAAAVILPAGEHPFRDSKQLSAEDRESLALEVKRVALAWGMGSASAAEVDEVNVLQATHLAAHRALRTLTPAPSALVTDYLNLSVPYPVVAVPKGDSKSLQVAAASILAKTHRDALLRLCAAEYPQYGFEQHKGYGSRRHLSALDRYGPCRLHRRTFRPVAERLRF